MTGEQGFQVARLGLLFNSVLGIVVALMLICTAPVIILEGEDPAAIVVGLVWGGLLLVMGLVGVGLAVGLERQPARWGARIFVLAQFVTMFCICGVLPLFGTLAVWIGLLVADREEG